MGPDVDEPMPESEPATLRPTPPPTAPPPGAWYAAGYEAGCSQCLGATPRDPGRWNAHHRPHHCYEKQQALRLYWDFGTGIELCKRYQMSGCSQGPVCDNHRIHACCRCCGRHPAMACTTPHKDLPERDPPFPRHYRPGRGIMWVNPRGWEHQGHWALTTRQAFGYE